MATLITYAAMPLERDPGCLGDHACYAVRPSSRDAIIVSPLELTLKAHWAFTSSSSRLATMQAGELVPERTGNRPALRDNDAAACGTAGLFATDRGGNTMRYWWWGPGHAGWVVALLGGLFWLLIVVLVIALIVRLVRGPRQRYWMQGSHPDDPEQVLRARFARGEIGADEFQQRLEVLRRAGLPPGK
ncbi:MAG: SHOCT domain-containing protein [Candidatus Limnocylindrales bacterium]